MANPYLPTWEYIPDGEPRVFGNRVYVYGSHDRVASDAFCDYKLKVWSASVDDLDHWVCHGDIFRTRDGVSRKADVDWSDNELYAPDVVEKDGKYYLYAYILNAKGCVAVSDKPEGPFTLLSQYKYDIPNHYDQGTFIDPGVLVDDDGRVYNYCGFQRSYMCEIKDNMYEVINETYQLDVIPANGKEDGFFEAASPRKVGDTYYFIYSPSVGSRLAYATSDSPTGPFTYRGYIVDNGVDYPGGNDHGSICKIKDQWYIFYHRMTNGTCMSRQGCVEKISILEDGTIPTVEMTSLGFQDALNPYECTKAEIACVLKEGPYVTELDPFTRVLTNIKSGSVMGWKYFDFGDDYTGDAVTLMMKLNPRGNVGYFDIYVDEVKEKNKIGRAEFENDSRIIKAKVKNVTGRHALYLVCGDNHEPGWISGFFEGRALAELESFQFCK